MIWTDVLIFAHAHKDLLCAPHANGRPARAVFFLQTFTGQAGIDGGDSNQINAAVIVPLNARHPEGETP